MVTASHRYPAARDGEPASHDEHDPAARCPRPRTPGDDPVMVLTVAGSGPPRLRVSLNTPGATPVFAAPAGVVLLDLSGVSRCGPALFALVERTQAVMHGQGQTLRLIGLGPAVLDALDQASLTQLFVLYRASAPHLADRHPPSPSAAGPGADHELRGHGAFASTTG
jgi:hypothetical protein